MYLIPQKLYSYPYRLLKTPILTLSKIIPTHPLTPLFPKRFYLSYLLEIEIESR